MSNGGFLISDVGALGNSMQRRGEYYDAICEIFDSVAIQSNLHRYVLSTDNSTRRRPGL